MEPSWLVLARGKLGLKERPGDADNPEIVQMFADVGQSWVQDDETAWCAAMVGSMLKRAGLSGTGKLNARSYLDWGVKLDKPVLGCIVVFMRGDPNGALGHVAFWLGETRTSVSVIGGNQSNAVTVASYPKSRVLGYRWPEGVPVPAEAPKPEPKAEPVPTDPVAARIAAAKTAREAAEH